MVNNKKRKIELTFNKYCTTVLKNEAKDYEKHIVYRKKNEFFTEKILEDREMFFQSDEYPSDFFELRSGDLVIRINSESLFFAIEKLSSNRKNILLLTYFFGFKVSEVAAKLNVSEKNVYYHLKKAVEELRKELGRGL